MASEPRTGGDTSTVTGSWVARSMALGGRDISPFSKSSEEVRRRSETVGPSASDSLVRRCIRLEPPKMNDLCFRYGCIRTPSTNHQNKTIALVVANPAMREITMGGIAVWGKNVYARQISPPPNATQEAERRVNGILPIMVFTHSALGAWNCDVIQRQANWLHIEQKMENARDDIHNALTTISSVPDSR